jgi:hypothetical protein
MNETGEPITSHELAQDQVARAVRDAWLASAELYRLRLNPETARFLAREEGELWSIHGRVKSVLDEIRSEHA